MKEFEKALKAINDSYKIVRRFDNGMSNYTFLITDNHNQKYVYRYPGEKNEVFVNYHQLYNTLKQISVLNISNELVYYNVDNGMKISKFIHGDVVDGNVDLNKVVQALKKIHTSNIDIKHYEHLKRLERYESISGNGNSEYQEIKEQWLKIYYEQLEEHIKYPTHGDAQFSNMVLTDNNEIKLFDFEFCAINDYIYDIAAFGNNDFKWALKLLDAYEKEVSKEHIRRLYGWRIFQCLQWYNVALYKEQIGLSVKFNIPFANIAEKYLKIAKELMDKYE